MKKRYTVTIIFRDKSVSALDFECDDFDVQEIGVNIAIGRNESTFVPMDVILILSTKDNI